MVVGPVATVEITLAAGAGQLLAIGGFAQSTDGISDRIEFCSGDQMQFKTVQAEQQAGGLVGFAPALRKKDIILRCWSGLRHGPYA